MERRDQGDELAGNAGAGGCGLNGESERGATEERVRALENALGHFLTVSPSVALLAAGVLGEEDAADYLAEYENARKVAQETLGPYQLDLGLARTQSEHARAVVGHDRPPAPAEAQFVELEPELER